MPSRPLAAVLAMSVAASAHAQTFVDGVAFVDRAASAEITLGNIRGSIGVIDFNNDGFMDLYFANSAGQVNQLFRNDPSATVPGGRTFSPATAGSGLNDASGTARSHGGVVVFDYDNDGDSDLYTAAYSSVPSVTMGLLYRNNGNGTFTDVSVVSGTRLSGLTPESLSAVDFDLDGDLDLFICSTSSPGRALTLLANNGDGTFTDRSDLLPPLAFTGRIYAHMWNDYDDDGWPDALVCLSASSPLTLRNVPNPSGGRMLADATLASGFTAIGPAPMGIAAGDFDLDGDLDFAITDAFLGTYYRNDNGVLTQFAPFSTFFGWGTNWLDADNDTRLDNYQAGSFGSSNIDHLRLNKGAGVWTDARPALNSIARPSQYSACLDFDNDGREDIVTVNVNQFISVYHNQSNTSNHWAKVSLIGAGATNRDAVGARIRLTAGGVTQVREIVAGSSFSATEDPRAHFGLGGATIIDRIEVRWPRAGTLAQRTQVFEGPYAADQIITLTPNADPCPGDANGDGVADFNDISATLSNWGNDYAPTTGPGDTDGNSVVEFSDLTETLANWLNDCN